MHAAHPTLSSKVLGGIRVDHHLSFSSIRMKAHANTLLASITIGCFVLRLVLFLAFQQYVSINSLIDAYLFPRLSANPWQVDWSYGPLTYLIYWSIAHLPLASLLARIPNFLADSTSTILVATIAGRYISTNRSLIASACWAFASPLIWASMFGSADSLPILAVLGAVYFTLTGEYKRAILLVGVGFTLKWFPILILPLIIRSRLSKRDLPRLLALSSFPFLLIGLLMGVASNLSGITLDGELGLTLHNFSSRVPAGTSIWNLLYAVISQNIISSTILIFASYSVITITLLVVSLRSPVYSSLQFLRSSAILLFCIVNIASQIQDNYLLWYYPLMLILILDEPVLRLVVTKLSLLASGFVFNFLFILPRLAAIGQGPLALRAQPTLYDILTIASFQASVWILLIMLTRGRIQH